MDDLNTLKEQIEFLKFRLDQAYRITKIYEDFILKEVGYERFTEFMKTVMNDLLIHDMNMSEELEKCINDAYNDITFFEEDEDEIDEDDKEIFEDDDDEDSI